MPRFTIVLRSSAFFLLLVAGLAYAQSGSPALVEPDEISGSGGKLRAAIAIRDGDTQIPNVGKRRIRYFQGWKLPADASDLKLPDPPASRTFAPGPTLRARVGDNVQIMLFNQVDEKNFAYTNDGTDCDKTFSTDSSGNTVPEYPYSDKYPNCFHGSSTANLHFHGTHTSPNGTGDNVLLQLIPNKDRSMEAKWAKMFEQVFSGPIPQKFSDFPPEYWEEQKKLLPEKLRIANEHRIAAGQWPQYFVGAFPNYLLLPDFLPSPDDPTKGLEYTAGQAPGTHWYHAHKHGSTALHMFNGLAGALIVEGPYDDYLREYYGLTSYGNFEKVLVFQQVAADLPLEKAAPGAPPPVLVNGQQKPAIEMKRGEVQLWRIVNATSGGVLATVGSDFFAPGNDFTVKQTAMDGVQFSPSNYASQPFLTKTPAPGPPNPPNGLTLAGGNRADVLIKAPDTAGTYSFKSNGTVVLYVKVVDQASTMCLPGDADPCPQKPWPAMPGYLADLPTPADRYPHTVTFGWDPEPTRTSVVRTNKIPPRFTIDNRQFAERGLTIDQCVRMGDSEDGLVQEWLVVNTTPTAHPFHIHINPFQIVSIDTPAIDKTGKASYESFAPPSNYVWRDVISIPAGAAVPDAQGNATQQIMPGRVKIRQRFVDFPGDFVLHCHILAHEDRGMMQFVRVVPPADYPAKCQEVVPEHH